MDELLRLREEINEVDLQMAELFLKRMEISRRIAAFKKEAGLPAYDPVREKEKLEEGRNSMPAELREDYAAFLEKIMELSREYQKRKMRES